MIYVFINDSGVSEVRWLPDAADPPKELEGFHLAGRHDVTVQGGHVRIAIYNIDAHRVKRLHG